jgi:hypothetical protein
LKLFDMDHDWLRPLWVRLLIVAIAGGWGIFELVTEQYLWATIFLVMGGYAAWSFFIAPLVTGEGSGNGEDGQDR